MVQEAYSDGIITTYVTGIRNVRLASICSQCPSGVKTDSKWSKPQELTDQACP